MKKTAITTTIMTLILIGTALAQPASKIKGSTALGGGSGVGIRNRQPQRIGNPIGLDGNIAGVKNRQANLGDTATHEVGHKGRGSNARRSISNAETARPNGITLTAEDYKQEYYKNPNSGQQGARNAEPAPTTSPATVRKGGSKTMNFSWGATQTGQWRTKQPRHR